MNIITMSNLNLGIKFKSTPKIKLYQFDVIVGYESNKTIDEQLVIESDILAHLETYNSHIILSENDLDQTSPTDFMKLFSIVISEKIADDNYNWISSELEDSLKLSLPNSGINFVSIKRR